jgi:flavin reductase (DIM6/NTAB) family NADH-FMN oxidoreductase RutF
MMTSPFTREPREPVSGESFSNAMARVCTPVSVVTTSDGSPHGTTVSAFTSLSLTPPMVLVSLDRGSNLLARLTRTRQFGLNVLSAAQAGLATRFAKKGPDTFDGITWYDESGCPRFEGVLAWLACGVADVIDGGDHRIVLGNVLRVNVFPNEPLTYHARAFGTHAPNA